MTTPTLTRPVNGSAYPAVIAELMPAARLLVDPTTGELPSRNRLKEELHIGAPKAREVLAALSAETGAPALIEPEPADVGPVGPDTPAALLNYLARRGYTDEQIAEEINERFMDADVVAMGLVTRPVSDPVPAALIEARTEPAARVTEPASPQAVRVVDPGTKVTPEAAAPVGKALAVWPVWVLALPAIVAIWSGWVGLGELAGFGLVRPLPGIADGFAFNSAITLPIGMEVYAAYALRVWLSGRVPLAARKFARVSALGSLGLGALGQVAYHLMTASGMTAAPWQITALVACLPVAVLGMAAILAHLIKTND